MWHVSRHMQSLRLPAALLAACTGFFFYGMQGTAMANELNGYLDLTYNHLETESRVIGGAPLNTEIDGFRQQYGLTLNKSLYPKLHLLASGILEKSRYTTTQDGVDWTSLTTITRPLIDLTLRDPIFTAGAGYYQQEVKTESRGTSASTLVNEGYSGIFAWRPDAFPSVSAWWKKTNVFDQARVLKDATDDLLSFTTTYEPFRNLRLRYTASRDDMQDRLQQSETRTESNSARASYDANLFNNRVLFSTSYQQSRTELDALKSKTGQTNVQLFAFSGLSALNDFPSTGALSANGALVDGNTAASAGVTIGLPVTVPGARNLGLDFGFARMVGSVAVWVSWNNTSLPIEIANTFSWDVYTSPDNLPTSTWTLQTTVFPAPFDPVQNRFEIPVPALTTRYLKVVVKPLTPAAALSSLTFSTAADQQISVTELQAFVGMATAGGPIVTKNRIMDGSLRVRLLDANLLFYDFNCIESVSEGITTNRRSSMSNALTLNKRFSEVFSGNMRAMREDTTDPYGKTLAYTYSAMAAAVPLKTMRHELTYSWRNDQTPQEKTMRNSLYLNNTAALYTGIDVNLSGGVSSLSSDTGRRSNSATLMAGASIAPLKNLSITPSYLSTASEQRGGGLPDTSTSLRSEEVSIVYSPLQTVYMAASWSKVTQPARRDRLQNYGINWSPFPGGALQFTVMYSENLRSSDDSIVKLATEAVRWNITSRIFLLASYSESRSTSLAEDSTLTSFLTELRYSF